MFGVLARQGGRALRMGSPEAARAWRCVALRAELGALRWAGTIEASAGCTPACRAVNRLAVAGCGAFFASASSDETVKASWAAP